MKIVWSRRETTCRLCDKGIEKKVQRLDDTIRIRKQIIRLHYHPECYSDYIKGWVENHPYTPMTSNGGHPSLGLTPEESKRRRSLIARLNSLKRYYFPKDGEAKINLQGDIHTLTESDLKRMQRYTKLYTEIEVALEDIGGLPESHGGAPEASRRRE
jgi:hypothetical protein